MTAPPSWIDRRIEDDLHNKLTQSHVVEVMLAAERSFFSITQIQARLKPDVSNATVRNRLDELCERDIVATEEYPDSITLYYIDYPESNWPLSPEGKHALNGEAAQYDLSVREFLTFSNAADIRTLALAGLQLALVLTVLGVVLALAGIPEIVQSDQQLWEAAVLVFGVSLLILFVEKAVRTARSSGRDGDRPPTDHASTS